MSPLDEPFNQSNDKLHYYYRGDPEPGPGASYLPKEDAIDIIVNADENSHQCLLITQY